jgi:hypothetical protein
MTSPRSGIFEDLGSWTASPCLEAVATRPTFRITSSRDRARLQQGACFQDVRGRARIQGVLGQTNAIRWKSGGRMVMFDHVERVKHWTTMACHVYDSVYCRVMTIAICDM